jgi:ligand-binding SRPBCC domain-containing protein
MLNIPLDWVTEITEIKDKEYFIDEQRKGPYRVWHHEHHFKEMNGGVMMTDRLSYEIGMGLIGSFLKLIARQNEGVNPFPPFCPSAFPPF